MQAQITKIITSFSCMTLSLLADLSQFPHLQNVASYTPTITEGIKLVIACMVLRTVVNTQKNYYSFMCQALFYILRI